jgi:hypothetical protein
VVKDFQTVGQDPMMGKTRRSRTSRILASVNPDVIDVDTTKAQDKTLLQKLLDNGFYDKIGNPARTP